MVVEETGFKKEEEKGEEERRQKGRSGEEKEEMSMLHKLAREMLICTTCLLKCYRPVICECVLCCLQVLYKPAALLIVDEKRQ